ncbi:DL-endopeptidase inhibitor IseA family protein [Pseudalkalibacillus caeni]|uniref:Uncharacterized protein n=1 Tax=Exobacillus caeni TaxID=2574798 RepID=A0A5R9F3Y5_9BACL|nr:DL-endopeptidase inhibitor IseA family protein [Pseudalkalibacillus caeni]TLS37209.1 hypothetical protein FCL54_11830 [Pseudalkalibacillus caeni]
MSKRPDNDFLQPLKHRPGLAPRKNFKQELRTALIDEADRTKSRLPVQGWFPNLLVASLLIFGIFIGSDFVLNSSGGNTDSPGHENPPAVPDQDQKDEKEKQKFDEKAAQQIIGIAFAHYSVVLNGGGPESGKTFTEEGEAYRYMGEDFDTKQEVLDYLEEAFTPEAALQIFGEHPFIVKKDKLAQPGQRFSGDYLWQDTEVVSITKKESESERIVEYNVPIEKEGETKSDTYEFTLKYVDGGWKLDGVMPLSSGEEEKESKDGPQDDTPEFMLTDVEMVAYKAFSNDLNEQHLKDLPPLSIAKLYVQAELEKRYDISYALYTDREGYVLRTKEEDQAIPESHRGTTEAITKQYKGLQNGKFIQTGEFEGYVKYSNANGEQGFRMIKDEDGIWNVGFNPIQ